MTERFNFYDIYGYLIPGLAFVSLLCVPFAATSSGWPDVRWSSALIGLIAAYGCGFLVNRLTAPFVRISIRDKKGRYRRPNDLLLDPPDPASVPPAEQRLSSAIRLGVIEGINRRFGLKVDNDESSRQDAFFLCRRLLQTDAPSYAEQFEGLYTFCLTFAAVLLIVAYYFLGWAASPYIPTWLAGVTLAALGIAFCGVFLHQRVSNYAVLFLLPVLLCVGIVAGRRSQLDEQSLPLLLGMSLAFSVLAIPFYRFFRYFSNVFTVTVYRDFYVLTQGSGRARHSGGEDGRIGEGGGQ